MLRTGRLERSVFSLRTTAVALAAMLAAGCAATPLPESREAACALPGTKPWQVAQLFFGRDIAGRLGVGEPEWRGFVAEVLAPAFPDGFSVLDASGSWRDPRRGALVTEPAKYVILAFPDRSAVLRLASVIEAYKQRFRQQSVGVILTESCAAF